MADIFAGISTIFSGIIGQITQVVTTVIGTPLFLAPVILSLSAAVGYSAIRIVKRLGLRGVGGRRRRRRR